MKTRNTSILLACAALILLTGCSPEEVVVGETSSPWRIFVGTDETDSRLGVVALPSNVLEDAGLATQANNSPGSGQISKLVNHRDYLYALVPAQFRIDVYSLKQGDNFRQVDTLLFAEPGDASGMMPSDLAFGTAITGYITFSNADSIAVLDATTIGDPGRCQICSFFPNKGTAAYAIVHRPNDNKLFTANMNNTVSVIATRTNAVTNVIGGIPPVPTFIAASPDGNDIVVLSMGAGKLNSTESPTESYLTFINSELESIAAHTPIFDTEANRTGAFPTGLGISEREYVFVSTREAVYRVDLRDRVSIRKVLNSATRKLVYNPKRDEIILLGMDDNRIRTLSATGSRLAGYTLALNPALSIVPR